ncbi:ATP-binding protein [Belliella kenyensis]|uniref:ATP-binding protein n=1 Tax=Belliella kenyensis TaxID=1472724 RepID=A0ABV8EJ40_9BACT|nr:ATP-binding protein [Belliella kenyensis]MCH7400377.1 ATP-binding protein [Belliella kenyensis]MDN3604605.1 ATP-binding protein [Belliella kenyensis]
MDVGLINQFLTDVFSFRGKNPKLKIDLSVQSFGGEYFDNFIAEYKLTIEEIILLLLTLTPYLNPIFLLSIFKESMQGQIDNPLLGGVKGKNHRGILPNGDLLLFLLAGESLILRLKYLKLLDEDHLFFKKNIITNTVADSDPFTSGVLSMNRNYVELFLFNKTYKPSVSSKFPAQRLQTKLEWEDLILSPNTNEQISEIKIWLEHNDELLADKILGKKVSRGFIAMFYGPSGTGKTLTATLLGKFTNKDVYRIDLSQVVSKYIGETEKNLSFLFDEAKDRDWILFFDEADAIFGKRTNVKDAHDKYANQEVSYLLQKIENHEGLVILASNFKGNIDSAFTRRFNTIIEFEMPKVAERIRIWENSIPEKLPFENMDFVENLARKYDLNGANIINVLHYAGLQTLSRREKKIKDETLIKGIKREYKKEGKII